MPLFEICRDGDFMKIKEFLNLIPPSVCYFFFLSFFLSLFIFFFFTSLI